MGCAHWRYAYTAIASYSATDPARRDKRLSPFLEDAGDWKVRLDRSSMGELTVRAGIGVDIDTFIPRGRAEKAPGLLAPAHLRIPFLALIIGSKALASQPDSWRKAAQALEAYCQAAREERFRHIGESLAKTKSAFSCAEKSAESTASIHHPRQVASYFEQLASKQK